MSVDGDSGRAPTAAQLMRWSGLAAIAAGVIFCAIQPIHPADVVASVTTSAWSTVIAFKLAMCLLFLVGISGLYARQADKTGWLGLAGFVFLVLSWWLQTGFVFAEAFVLPVIAGPTPAFVESFLGVANGSPGEMPIGALPGTYAAVGLLYMAGGILFGIATVRAGVLPRAPAILLAVAALVTPAAALLPHEMQRYAAIPVGVAVAWLGYALWSEKRTA